MSDNEAPPFAPFVFRPPKKSWTIHIILFVLTVITTTFAGALIFVDQQQSDGWLSFFLFSLFHTAHVYSVGSRNGALSGRQAKAARCDAALLHTGNSASRHFRGLHQNSVGDYQFTGACRGGSFRPDRGCCLAIPLLFFGLCLSEVRPDVAPASSGLEFGSSIILELLSLAPIRRFFFQYHDYSAPYSGCSVVRSVCDCNESAAHRPA